LHELWPLAPDQVRIRNAGGGGTSRYCPGHYSTIHDITVLSRTQRYYPGHHSIVQNCTVLPRTSLSCRGHHQSNVRRSTGGSGCRIKSWCQRLGCACRWKDRTRHIVLWYGKLGRTQALMLAYCPQTRRRIAASGERSPGRRLASALGL